MGVFIKGSNCGGDCCDLDISTSGGDEGYDQSFGNTCGLGGALDYDFDAFTLEDRLRIYADGVTIYDSGCISGTASGTVTVPTCTVTVRVEVVPHCNGGSGTVWNLEVHDV